MSTKHNKKRYQATPKPPHPIVATGRVSLLHYDDDEAALCAPKKGDMRASPSTPELHNGLTTGAYNATGFEGYFRLEIYSGDVWLPVVLQSVFPGREHYYSKHDRSIDVYALLVPMLAALQGRCFTRTYREHYTLEENDA